MKACPEPRRRDEVRFSGLRRNSVDVHVHAVLMRRKNRIRHIDTSAVELLTYRMVER